MSVSPSILPLLILAALGLAFTAVFWWGARHRRQLIPPSCRRCVSAPAGGEGTSSAIYVPVSVERARQMTKLTLVLVGDGEALKPTLDQQKFWAGRIVFPDVPLGVFKDHYDDATRRAPSTLPYRVEIGQNP